MRLDEWHETGDRFLWRGHEVFYQEAGEGPVLFLLHGFATSSWLFKYLWPTLSKHFRVIAPDYLGFGFSSKPADYSYGMDERVEMIYALADLLSIKECHFMAHSFSVNIVQELLYHQIYGKSKVEILSAVMLNGALFPDESTPSFRQRLMLKPLLGKWVSNVLGYRAFKGGLGSRVGKYSKFPDDLIDDLFQQLLYKNGLRHAYKINKYLIERSQRKERLKEGLLKTNVPVQLIWGIDVENQIAGIRHAHKYRELKTDKYVVMLKDIGHFPMVECPELVLEYYLSFINGIGSYRKRDLAG